MKKGTKYLLIFVVVLGGIFLLTNAFSFAKYASSEVWNYYLQSKGFYFSSDELGLTALKNVNNHWDGNPLTITLRNSTSEEAVSDYDIEYRATCTVSEEYADQVECIFPESGLNTFEGTLSSEEVCMNGDILVESMSKSECEMNQYTWKTMVSTKELALGLQSLDSTSVDEAEVHVTVESTKPYHQTLEGDFLLKRDTTAQEVFVTDFVDRGVYGELSLSNSSEEDRCLFVRWDQGKLRLDSQNDNSILTKETSADDYINGMKVKIEKKNSLNFTFYKTDFEAQADINEFTFVEEDC